MMRRYLNIVVASFALFVSLKAGAQVLPSLHMNQDAASMGMGSAGVASKAGAFVIENNIAAIPFAEQKMAVQAGFGIWQPSYANNKTIGLGGMYKVSPKIGLALDFKYLMLPSYSGVTGNGADIRDSEFSPSEMNLAAGVSYKIIDCLSAGLTLRYAGSTLAPEASANVFAVDFGVFFQKNSVSAGLSLNNLGTDVKYSETAYPQPMHMKAGAGYDLEMGTSRIFFTAQADFLFAGGFAAGAGCEYSFKNIVFARAGYHYGDAVNVVPSYASFGLGLKFFGVTLDAAYLVADSTSPMRNTLRFGIGYRF